MISRLTSVAMIFATGVLAVAALATAQTKDPFVGAWRLNIAKSKYSLVLPRRARQARTKRRGKGTKFP